MTPSSKVVGDLALHLVAVGADPDDFEANPQKYDVPPTPSSAFSPASSATRRAAGQNRSAAGLWRAARSAFPRSSLTTRSGTGLATDRRATLNELLFPGPTRDFLATSSACCNWSVLSSIDFFAGLRPGDELPGGGSRRARCFCSAWRRSGGPTIGGIAQ